MRITFELESADIERFRAAFARSREVAGNAEEIDVLDAARHALDTLCVDAVPSYVRKRLVHVQRLIVMLEDDAWSLPDPDRAEVLAALAYFADPEDLIPDHLEVIGLLDDAVMLELLARRMRHVLEGYARFCAFRSTLGAPPPDPEGRSRHARALLEERNARVTGVQARRRRIAAWLSEQA